jgi:hypothetical protein
MEIVPYKAEHLEALKLQEAQQDLSGFVTPADAKALEQGDAYTAMDGDEVLVCAGVMPIWKGRGMAWAYVSQNAGRRMLALTRAVQRFFEVAQYDRIEAAVEENFKAGHRWARLLGFKCETPEPMAKFLPNGSAARLYARVKS